jgi:hypothetical protein
MKSITIFMQMLLTGFLIAAGLSGVISLIGWLAGGWASVRQFSDGLFISGAVVIILGIVSIVGGFTARADFGMVYSQSAGDMSSIERTRLMMADMIRGYRVVTMAAIIGGLLVIFSILIYQIFG